MQHLNYNKLTNVLTLTALKETKENQKPPIRTKDTAITFTRSKFKRIQNYALVYQAENEQLVCKENVFFITITTKQNANELTDKECTNVLSMWLELRKKQQKVSNYVWWAERQNQTNDIHYHVIIWSKKATFQVKENVKYFEKYFGLGTNLFNRKQIEENNLLSVVKYITEYSKKFIQSEFNCKISQASLGLTKVYRQQAYKYIIKKIISDDLAASIGGQKIYKSEYVTTIIKPKKIDIYNN